MIAGTAMTPDQPHVDDILLAVCKADGKSAPAV
jgi:hypothetical protein